MLDRQNPQKVARYFETFLDAARTLEDTQLTEKLVQVTRDVVRENRGLVPDLVYSQITKRTYEAASAGGKIDVDGHKAFLDAVMGGPIPDEHPIVAKFLNGLKRARIDGVPLNLNSAMVSRPTTRRLVTMNDVQISVPYDLADELVKIESTRIIIKDRVRENYDDSERPR